MKKKGLLTLVGSICLMLVVAALLLPACAKKEEAPVTPAAPTPAAPTPAAPTPAAPTPVAPAGYDWPSALRMAVPGIGTGGQTMTAALAPIMEKHIGMKVRVIPEGIESKIHEMLSTGRVEIASQSVSEQVLAVTAEGGYADKHPAQTRVAWEHWDLPWGWLVLGDSDIRTIYDLKKKGRIALNTTSGTQISTTDGLLAFLGVTKEEVTIVPIAGYSAHIRALPEGKADVCLASPASTVTYEIAGNPRGIRYLAMPLEDKEGWERFIPYRATCVPSKMAYGVPEAIGVDGFTSHKTWWVMDDTDQEFVYQLVKWWDENYDLFKDAHSSLPRMSIDVFRSYLDVAAQPISEGAIRYLKEVGKWTADDDKWNEEAIELVTKYIEANEAAWEEAKTKGITTSVTNQEWLDLIAQHTAGLPGFVSRL